MYGEHEGSQDKKIVMIGIREDPVTVPPMTTHLTDLVNFSLFILPYLIISDFEP